jgi:hypothetical protein
MKTKPAFLVVAMPTRGRVPVIRRATQSWPALDSGEAVIKISLELPDTVFEHPIVTVAVDATEVAVAAVEGEEKPVFSSDN